MKNIEFENFTLITSQESRCGYREDDWQIITIIDSEKKLYEALKEGHLKDAGHRNNYPILAHDFGISLTYQNFSKYEGDHWLGYDMDNEEDYRTYYDCPDLRSFDFGEDEVLLMEKYNHIFEKFRKWQNKLKTLIPRLREIKDKEDKIKKDLANLFKLAEKYNYNLIKKDK